MFIWMVAHGDLIKIIASGLLTFGSVVLAFRVKSLIALIGDVLNAHEKALCEIKDISESPKWDNAGRLSASVDDGLTNGMAVTIDRFNAKKGAVLLVIGFGSLALGGSLNFAIGILMKFFS
ncbi:hypothetical protein RMR26_23200 [Enterobacter cloacae]|uniref:hypothetical protein n=1 Tax=Enterobacter TaxID=547 RepID=UPI000F867587|nr:MULTISPECIES: hypothetical protein [Enterobacter]MDT0537910.1 hypothetical protein [Enterobacter cloacae]RTN95709.1 hypothetical protein EKN83_12620 [Enterobacter sp. WCHEn090032]HDC4405423.1 hypothetical protein [Enterobacter cloacae]